MFDCCCDGRKTSQGFSNGKETCTNQDGLDIGNNHKHPFLIVSETKKNNHPETNYLTVLPITSSLSSYNLINGVPLDIQMVDKKGEGLVRRKSIIKFDCPTRIYKSYLSLLPDCFKGEILPKPYQKIISRMTSSLGGTDWFKD